MVHSKLAILGRRLFTTAAVLSLILCVTAIALWARSYGPWKLASFFTRRGIILVDFAEPGVLSVWWRPYIERQGVPGDRNIFIDVKYRWIVTGTAILPALWAARLVWLRNTRSQARGFQIVSRSDL